MTQQHETDIHPDDQSFIWTWGDLDPDTGEYTGTDEQQ